MKYFSLLVFVSLTTLTHAQTGDEKIIRNLLDRQTKDWNNGNIEAFMKGYWESDSLMFVGKSGVTYGYQKTLNNYKKNYPDTTAMGKLRFHILEVRRLSADHYFVLGKWMLTRTIGDLSGHYTLIFRKIKGKWNIIADHSS
ncbi:YybH family protein [Sediminibacterium goheungense]|uniref:Uncharacterized protein DUF4440 n=1 Tax=Sediminibacterium goheungense TaxID=1086393 RepID=A0A4R6J240_9BACT|nr:nuclear transport factor 2 family protein [Sediminibacterium goheungense]TDO28947.1 uncharacterized protein DUF4440 [Sediminibacterium goheungense]